MSLATREGLVLRERHPLVEKPVAGASSGRCVLVGWTERHAWWRCECGAEVPVLWYFSRPPRECHVCAVGRPTHWSHAYQREALQRLRARYGLAKPGIVHGCSKCPPGQHAGWRHAGWHPDEGM